MAKQQGKQQIMAKQQRKQQIMAKQQVYTILLTNSLLL